MRKLIPPLTNLTDRLTKMASHARNRAEVMSPGPKRDALLRAARISENALQVQQWLSSAGLRTPS
jgi:hypothetical protein